LLIFETAPFRSGFFYGVWLVSRGDAAAQRLDVLLIWVAHNGGYHATKLLELLKNAGINETDHKSANKKSEISNLSYITMWF
jgi:hypothetical protein